MHNIKIEARMIKKFDHYFYTNSDLDVFRSNYFEMMRPLQGNEPQNREPENVICGCVRSKIVYTPNNLKQTIFLKFESNHKLISTKKLLQTKCQSLRIFLLNRCKKALST